MSPDARLEARLDRAQPEPPTRSHGAHVAHPRAYLPGRAGMGVRGPRGVSLLGAGKVGAAVLGCLKESGIPVASIETSRGREGTPGGILVDCTPPRYTGAPAWAWVERLEAALASGQHVVTCNKAPLALAWLRLHEAARAGGAILLATATVGGGTPVLPTVRRLAAHGIEAIEGSLSGTLSFVAQRVQAGSTHEEAVEEAVRLGYTEPDPAIDLDGTDLMAKAVLLHNTAFGPPLSIAEIGLRPLAGTQPKPGERALAIVRPGHAQVVWGEAPWLAGSPGGEARVRVHLQDGRTVSIAGPGAGPQATARAVLADIQEALAW